jgi:hypothetical protein
VFEVAGDCGTFGSTIDTFLLGVELADFFSFNFDAKLLEDVGGTTGVFGAEFIVAVVIAMASSCCGVSKINWKPGANLCEMSSVKTSSLVGTRFPVNLTNTTARGSHCDDNCHNEFSTKHTSRAPNIFKKFCIKIEAEKIRQFNSE